MANAASTIEIELEIRDAINRLGRLEGELKKSSSAMDRVANSTNKMESAFKSARNAASALVAAISVQQIAQAADTFTNFANQIRIATNSAAEAAAVQKELYRVSQTTGTAIEDTAKLYARLRVAADQLGSSQAETIRITEIVAKALAAAGTSSTEASGALLQLAQALNSPKVQAEEFNSLIDGMPNLLKEVEKQLGLTAGSLKKFVTDGNLTNQLFKDAILGSAEAINEQFGAAQDTIGTATQRINNSLTMLIGKFEQSTGIFNKTANALTKLATEFDKADNIVHQFSEVVVMLGVYFDKLKQLALALTKPLRDAFSVFSGGTSNPIAKTINYIQYSLSLLTVAVDYQTQNLAIRLERLAYQIRDFFIGMVANLLSFFESVDNFFINQINKVIGYYNSAADSIGMDGDVAPIATSTSARESELKFERDSAEFLADSYRRQADLLRQAEEAYAAVNAEFNQYTQQIDSGTLIKTEEQLGNVNLEAANAASSVEKLKEKVEEVKEKIEEVKEIEYTDFTGKISQEQQDRFTEALEEEFRIRREMKQLTEAQNEAYGQQLEDQFRQVAEVEEYLGRINERGIERNEVEQINYDYANEIAKVKADQNLTIEQEIQLVNALEDAQQRELNNQEKKLTYLDKVNESLQEQLGLSEGAAAAVISGVSAAGPNASRGMNIAQSKSLDEAAYKLILSNEKVAAAIEEYFTILFDTIDPLIDILGDLISAINRLIGALLKNVTNAAEGLLDTVGLGPNGYIFGGGLARDLENAFGFGPGSSKATGPTATQAAIASADKVFAALGTEQSSLEKLQPKIDELAALLEDIPLASIIERFAEQTQKAVAELETAKDWYEKTLASGEGYRGAATPTFTNYLKGEIEKLDAAIAEVNEKTSIVISGLISEFLSEPLATLDDLEKSATDSIAAIEFQNLSAEEQIQFRYDEAIATIEQQRALADLINDEELRSQLLDSVNRATQAQNDLLEKQQEELQKLNEEREREAALMLQQQGQAQVDKLLSDLEKTFDNIIELVQDLRDQATGLLFGSSSTLTNQQKFELAASEYQELLAAALDPDATEENVKDFQDFVDTYLKSAQDVFKSSSRYQNIFNSVLADIEEVANFVSIAMPINEIESVKKQLVEVAEEFGLSMEEVVEGLDRLVLALTFRALVVDVPIETVIDEANSDLVVEAVVTAIADTELSDTQIEAVVTAIMAAGSDTVIDAIVKAVQAPGSNTTIKAVVNAIAASSSDLQIEAVVSAVANQQLSDLQIEAIVTAVKASGSDTVIEAVVSAVEDKILSDTEIEAIVTAVKASGSNTVISAIVSAIAAAGSDTQIKALVTAIAAAGSDTQIEAIVKAIMASGSDTQIEAIVSAVASNTPVISAIVAAVAANTPVVTPNISLDDSNISAAFDSLSQTLENSIGSLIATIQLQSMLATATAEGIYSPSARSFDMSGAQGVISGYAVDLKPRGDFSDYQYGLAEGVQFTGALSTQDQFSALINSAETENPAIRNNPYYVLFPAAETGNTTKARLFGFTDLTKAEDFYNYYSSRTFSYINDNGTLKYGFAQGGLVPDPLDTIPAMLSPGEYILSPETVRRYGVSNLNRLNSGDTAALNATSDPEVKRLLAELIVAVRENDTEVNVYTDMAGQTKAGIEEFRSELRERTRRQGDQYIPARYI